MRKHNNNDRKEVGMGIEIIALLVISVICIVIITISLCSQIRNPRKNLIVRDSPQDIFEECQRCRELEAQNMLELEQEQEIYDDLDDAFNVDIDVVDLSVLADDNEEENEYVANPYIALNPALQEFTQKKCEEYSVSYPIVLAIMESESSFREDIGNEKVLGGDEDGYYYGYMQLSADNIHIAKIEYGLDAHTPEGNIEYGIILIRKYIDKYGELDSVINAYKAGEGAADIMLQSGTKLDCCDSLTTRVMELQDIVFDWEIKQEGF